MSNPTSPAPGSAREWIEHARSDLKYARLGEAHPEVLSNQAAFHAQQLAEKALKAVLVLRGIPFPKTHDVKDLIQRWTKAGFIWPADLADIKSLNPYAFEMRYPGYLHQVSRAEVRAAIAIAEKVVAWADGAVDPPTAPPPSAPGGGTSS